MKDLKELYYRIEALTLFDDFKYSHVGEGLLSLFEFIVEDFQEPSMFVSLYSNLCSEIYREGGDLGKFIKSYLNSGSNLYVDGFIEDNITSQMEKALKEELKTLQYISELSSIDIIEYAKSINIASEDLNYGILPKWENTAFDVKNEFKSLIKNIGTKGYGIFSSNIMFKVRNGELIPVRNADYQTLDQLHGYERERNLVLQNTEALAKGRVASNVLLYGDAGTGKSTTVKACAAHYSDKGVRLVEFDKNQVSIIPEIAEELSKSPLKFIFFIDDLTFTDNDDDYYALKGILEGNVSGTAPNILIYATSNRRHLVKESMTDRIGDDLHLNDTLQETMSLSSRFGLTITFSKPDKDLYLSIIEKMAKEQGIKLTEDLYSKAEAFAIRSNGRSPRTAKQFIVLYKNKIQ